MPRPLSFLHYHPKSGAGLQLDYNATATNNQNCKTAPFCKFHLNRLKLMEGKCSLDFQGRVIFNVFGVKSSFQLCSFFLLSYSLRLSKYLQNE